MFLVVKRVLKHDETTSTLVLETRAIVFEDESADTRGNYDNNTQTRNQLKRQYCVFTNVLLN